VAIKTASFSGWRVPGLDKMAANFLIFVGSIASILVLLDMLLTEAQKESLSGWTLRQSTRVRDARTRAIQFLERLFSSEWRAQATPAVVVIMATFLSGGNALLLWWFGARSHAIWIALIMTFPIALIFVRIIFSPRVSFQGGAMLAFPFVVLLHIPIWTALWLAPSDRVIGLDVLSEWNGFAIQGLNGFITFAAFYLLQILFLVILNIALFVLVGFEFVLKRIAEYSKGPILAAGVIFTTLATLLKYVTG
jgi:hypothetical protein